MEIDLGMAEGEKIVKIKAGMNRSAVFTSKGRCLVFGGREDSPTHCNRLLTKKLVDDNREGVVDYSQEFGDRIVDIGLGLMHTLVITE